MIVVPKFRVQIPLTVQWQEVGWRKIVAKRLKAKDIIEPNEDTVDNDLKGVLRARLRARADSVIESVGFYSPRFEQLAAIFYIRCKPLILVKYSKYVEVVTLQDHYIKLPMRRSIRI